MGSRRMKRTMTNSITCPQDPHPSIWIIPVICLSLSLLTFSLLFTAYLHAHRARRNPHTGKKNIAAFHEDVFDRFYVVGKNNQSESGTPLEDHDSASCSTSPRSISLEVETALHEKYSLIPPEYVEDGVETARRMSIERRSSSISPSVHSSSSFRPRSDSQAAIEAMLPVVLGFKEQDNAENAINLWGNARQRSKKSRYHSSASEPASGRKRSIFGKELLAGFKRSASQDNQKDSRRISWPDEVTAEVGGRKNSALSSDIHQSSQSEQELKETQLAIIYEIDA